MDKEGVWASKDKVEMGMVDHNMGEMLQEPPDYFYTQPSFISL